MKTRSTGHHKVTRFLHHLGQWVPYLEAQVQFPRETWHIRILVVVVVVVTGVGGLGSMRVFWGSDAGLI